MMIQPTVTRAVAVGIAVLILANVLWVGVLWEVKFYEMLRMMLLIAPGISSFLVAYLAPRGKNCVWNLDGSVGRYDRDVYDINL
jgi:hypothetical protein